MIETDRKFEEYNNCIAWKCATERGTLTLRCESFCPTLKIITEIVIEEGGVYAGMTNVSSFAFLDCEVPLGLSSGRIPDGQITASSYRESLFPYYARLNSDTAWCSKKDNKRQYIQIDLGEVI